MKRLARTHLLKIWPSTLLWIRSKSSSFWNSVSEILYLEGDKLSGGSLNPVDRSTVGLTWRELYRSSSSLHELQAWCQHRVTINPKPCFKFWIFRCFDHCQALNRRCCSPTYRSCYPCSTFFPLALQLNKRRWREQRLAPSLLNSKNWSPRRWRNGMCKCSRDLTLAP